MMECMSTIWQFRGNEYDRGDLCIQKNMHGGTPLSLQELSIYQKKKNSLQKKSICLKVMFMNLHDAKEGACIEWKFRLMACSSAMLIHEWR